MTYPRAIALSQALWGGTKAPYNAFEDALKTYHIPRLTGPILNTNVSLSFMKPEIKFEREPYGISLSFEFKDTNESVVVSFPRREEGIWLSQGKKLAFKRPQKNSIQQKFTYFSPCCADSLTIIEHLGLGAKVTYNTPPNTRYDSGDLTLVDGQFGARPWRGYQWVGFDTNTIEITIDLEEKRKIKGLELGFLYEPSSWIHLPSEVKLTTNKGKTKSVKITSERTVIRFRNKTQSLRLQITGPKTIPSGFPGEGNTPWIFMDEILIK
jgi:hexosaminidase